ncbi:hypothetical protein CHLRE_13g577450v5 [Chlamydomonas reinhardtii]|uniref:glycerol-3-phosphate dehydrogenase n=1 Tax=Chlamydomonas reinhardtii TaxID=3055 RepID=A0A2K3D061_CHLRE|nr:uncharacterized protein CHLRE_13g577450v5 [Chlamydomonas reinhardtii]PNW73901.1 hypothetical protein CHLRE_13g577450v5 [Chlamydomonas reinhardtii]
MPLLSMFKALPAVAAAGALAAVSGAGYLLTQQQQHLWGGSGRPEGDDDLELLERPPPRPAQLERLRGSSRDRPFDLLVIGGGATGSGCALDAVTRMALRLASGWKLSQMEWTSGGGAAAGALGEAAEEPAAPPEPGAWAAAPPGASSERHGAMGCPGGPARFHSARHSCSTDARARSAAEAAAAAAGEEKSVPGGGGGAFSTRTTCACGVLDYRQLRLVWEALHERAVMLALAPHLAHPLPILTPCYKWWEVPYYWAGLKAYDLVAGRRSLVLSRYVAPTEALGLFPTLAQKQPDTGRQLKGANPDGKVVGAVVQDRLGQEPAFEVYARVVMNTTGCFSDQVRHMSQPDAPDIIQPSSGAHVTLPAWYAGTHSNGLIIPKTKDGRVVFMIPFLGHVIAGTTDSRCAVTARPTASSQEVGFILEALQDYLDIQVRPSDVLSTWSGIRPLAADPRAKDTQNTVRDHVIIEESDGMITVSGGKWTTYRSMAEEAVDLALATGRMPPNARPHSRTARLPLLGGAGYSHTLPQQLAQEHGRAVAEAAGGAGAAAAAAAAAKAGAGRGSGSGRVVIDEATAAHLAQAYGSRAGRVLQTAEDRGLGSRLVAGHPFLEAEVVYAVRHEYCHTPEDFLARRTRLAFLDARAALSALPRVVDIMAAECGWDAARRSAMSAAARDYLSTYLPTPAAAPAAPEPAVAASAVAAAAPAPAA